MRSKKWDPVVQSTTEPPPAATNKYNSMKGPPCSNCSRWNPQVTYRPTPSGQERDGIRCCWADQMHHDFSCFDDADHSEPS